MLTDAEQSHRQESIFSHDDEVDEESSSGLNHTDLTISHRDESRDFFNGVVKNGGGRKNFNILGKLLPISFQFHSCLAVISINCVNVLRI